MSESFDLQAYLSKGIEDFMKDLLKATLQNPRESAFMLRFAAATAAASRKRRKAEDNGLHIPSFLIASITSQCNLHCAGCYSRCNHATVDAAPVQQLTSEEWLKIFSEADELGISFILLAGGEPMLRRDIIEAAGKRSNILFPIFTNGTFMDARYFDLFDRCRNLVPIMSIEGEQAVTDARRGEGIYDRLVQNMDELHRRGLIYGASVTVTTENIREVTSESFLKTLSDRGCKSAGGADAAAGAAPGNGLSVLPRRRKELRRLCRGRPRLFPHQFPRRRGAVSVLPVFGRERQKYGSQRRSEFQAVCDPARKRAPAGGSRGRLRAVRKAGSGGAHFGGRIRRVNLPFCCDRAVLRSI